MKEPVRSLIRYCCNQAAHVRWRVFVQSACFRSLVACWFVVAILRHVVLRQLTFTDSYFLLLPTTSIFKYFVIKFRACSGGPAVVQIQKDNDIFVENRFTAVTHRCRVSSKKKKKTFTWKLQLKHDMPTLHRFILTLFGLLLGLLSRALVFSQLRCLIIQYLPVYVEIFPCRS